MLFPGGNFFHAQDKKGTREDGSRLPSQISGQNPQRPESALAGHLCCRFTIPCRRASGTELRKCLPSEMYFQERGCSFLPALLPRRFLDSFLSAPFPQHRYNLNLSDALQLSNYGRTESLLCLSISPPLLCGHVSHPRWIPLHTFFVPLSPSSCALLSQARHNI